MTSFKPTPLAWIPSFLVLSLVWGLSFLFIKIGLRVLEPLQVAFYRIFLGALTLLIVLLITRTRLPLSKSFWAHSAIASVFLYAVPFSLFAFAGTRIPSALSGIWNATTPLFTVVAAMLILSDEKPTRGRVIGLIASFCGVVVVLAPWKGFEGADPLATVACLAAAACYGIGSPYVRRHIAGQTGLIEQTSIQLLCATAIMLPTQFFYGIPRSWPVEVTLSMLAMGCLGTALAYLLINHLFNIAGSVVASTVTFVIPIVSTLAGVLLLNERIGIHAIVGATIIIGGMVAYQIQSSRPVSDKVVAP
jgi:drug/metabolite transporter (DMT)-like permease